MGACDCPSISSHPQPTGAWFTILEIISFLSVITNAFLIGVTAQWVPFEVYDRGDYQDEYNPAPFDFDLKDLSGYVNWSLSNFPIEDLVDGRAFPAMNAQELPLYDDDGDEVTNADGDTLLYLPWINTDCLEEKLSNPSTFLFNVTNITIGGRTEELITAFTEDTWSDFYNKKDNRELLFIPAPDDNETPEEGSVFDGSCFVNNSGVVDRALCR